MTGFEVQGNILANFYAQYSMAVCCSSRTP